MSFLLPSDPVVIYGGIGYLWNIERNIDRVVGDVFVGKVDPGDAINANVGFGFALNPRFSFSLGQRQSLSLGFKFGVTEDAPDVGITMRIPFRF